MSTETADTTCATTTPVTPTKTAAPGSNQNTPSKETDDAMNQLVQGKRHLLVKDYVSAVATLGKACELLAAKFGDTAPECGDAYLSYGKALLELARQETGVLEMNESDKGDDSDDEEGDEDGDGDEDEDAKEEDDKPEEKDVNGKEVGKAEEENKEANGEAEKETNGKAEKETNGKAEKETNGKAEKEDNDKTENKDDRKTENEADDKTEMETEGKEMGETKENGNEAEGEGEKMEDEDDVNNLQLSWEMLELAKVIFQKMKEAGEDNQAPLKLAEVYLKLGEVGVESENYNTAVEDMKACLEIQREVLEDDDRRIAETLFQMGAAYSMNNDFDAAIEQFKEACVQIQRRIAKLEKTKEGPVTEKAEGGDAFYSVEGEIKELKALLPEIQEKITDMQDFKKETMRRMMESLAAESAKVSSTADGAGPSSAADKSDKTDKPVSSIAHLVKRKPKDEVKEEVKSETKKVDGGDSLKMSDKTTVEVKKDCAEVKEKGVTEGVSKDKEEVKDSEIKDQPMDDGEKADSKADVAAIERKRKSQDEEPSEVPKKAKIDEAEVKSE